MLDNGEVLISGGANVFGVDQQTVVQQSGVTPLDPTTGQSALTGSMSIPREDHTLTLLPNGQMLAAGGLHANQQQGQPQDQRHRQRRALHPITSP
jgi:hypothetical protein